VEGNQKGEREGLGEGEMGRKGRRRKKNGENGMFQFMPDTGNLRSLGVSRSRVFPKCHGATAIATTAPVGLKALVWNGGTGIGSDGDVGSSGTDK
jgi:hypothetical protein